MVRTIFVRHGQSTANVGIFTPSFADVQLTEVGIQQAGRLAATWQAAPSLIAVSPYLRAQQTAAPTIARFPDVPVETWPIYEFTLWDPAFWDYTDPELYPEIRARYWSEADPNYRHGEGAESFSMFMERARSTLRRLEAQPEGSTVMLFSHGHLIQAMRFEIFFPDLTDKVKMEQFLAFDQARWVRNAQCIPAEFDGVKWSIEAGEPKPVT
jgi:broad specificity phosphatase PhoE